MAFRKVAGDAPAIKLMTAAQKTALVAAYGPAGTVEVNGIKPGTMIYETDTNKLGVFDGTAFKLAPTAFA